MKTIWTEEAVTKNNNQPKGGKKRKKKVKIEEIPLELCLVLVESINKHAGKSKIGKSKTRD